MAFSYLTNDQKVSIGLVLDNIHETFAREITLFQIGKKLSISTNDEYNSFYSSQTSENLQPQTLTVKARIRYLKADEELFSLKDNSSTSGKQDKIVLPAGSVKIKVDAAAKDFLRDAKRVELDGNRYTVVTNGRLIAMFGPSISPYWEYILAPMDENG